MDLNPSSKVSTWLILAFIHTAQLSPAWHQSSYGMGSLHGSLNPLDCSICQNNLSTEVEHTIEAVIHPLIYVEPLGLKSQFCVRKKILHLYFVMIDPINVWIATHYDEVVYIMDGRQIQIITVVTVGLFFSLLSVGLRCYTRIFVSRTFGSDDYWILLGLVSGTRRYNDGLPISN